MSDDLVKTKIQDDARLAAKFLECATVFETGQTILLECADRIEELENLLADRTRERNIAAIILGMSDDEISRVLYRIGSRIDIPRPEGYDGKPLPDDFFVFVLKEWAELEIEGYMKDFIKHDVD